MNATKSPRPDRHDGQAVRLLARARRRQLDLAIQGRVFDSTRWAHRADTIRQAACEATFYPDAKPR